MESEEFFVRRRAWEGRRGYVDRFDGGVYDYNDNGVDVIDCGERGGGEGGQGVMRVKPATG